MDRDKKRIARKIEHHMQVVRGLQRQIKRIEHWERSVIRRDARRRAFEWLDKHGVVLPRDIAMAKLEETVDKVYPMMLYIPERDMGFNISMYLSQSTRRAKWEFCRKR